MRPPSASACRSALSADAVAARQRLIPAAKPIIAAGVTVLAVGVARYGGVPGAILVVGAAAAAAAFFFRRAD